MAEHTWVFLGWNFSLLIGAPFHSIYNYFMTGNLGDHLVLYVNLGTLLFQSHLVRSAIHISKPENKLVGGMLVVSTPLKNRSEIGNLPQIAMKNKEYLKPPPKQGMFNKNKIRYLKWRIPHRFFLSSMDTAQENPPTKGGNCLAVQLPTSGGFQTSSSLFCHIPEVVWHICWNVLLILWGMMIEMIQMCWWWLLWWCWMMIVMMMNDEWLNIVDSWWLMIDGNDVTLSCKWRCSTTIN